MTHMTARQSDHQIDPIFLDRWSPRSFTGEKMPEGDLHTILEAARWAPSANNTQPWRYVYALKGTPEFDNLVAALMGFNQVWAPNASALVIAVAQTEQVTAEGETKPMRYASHDTGASTMALVLQAVKMGYHAHVMGGVDRDKANAILGIPEKGWSVETAIAIGKLGDPQSLPDSLREREKPSARLPLSEIAFQGRFRA